MKHQLNIAEKKALLRLIFRKIVVKEGVITEVDLFEPFKQLVSEAELECLRRTVKPRIRQRNLECTYKLSDGRWPRYRRTMETIIEAVAGLEWYK